MNVCVCLFVCCHQDDAAAGLNNPAGAIPVQSTAQQGGKWMVLAGLSVCELVVMAAWLWGSLYVCELELIWACLWGSLSVCEFVIIWAYLRESLSVCEFVVIWACLWVSDYFATFLSPPPAWCPPVLLVLVLASLFQSSRRLSIFTCRSVQYKTAVNYNNAVPTLVTWTIKKGSYNACCEVWN